MLKNRYYTSVNYVDSLIGDLLAFLDREGLADSTLVVVTGDHGELFHEHHGAVTHGANLYEEVLRVPLVFSGVSSLRRVLAEEQPAAHIDIGPSILAVLGLPQHKAFQGLAVVDTEQCPASKAAREYLFASVQGTTHEDAVIYWPWKLVVNYRGRQPRLVNITESGNSEVDHKEHKPELVVSLLGILKKFREIQFSYYLGAESVKHTFYPPDIPLNLAFDAPEHTESLERQ